MNSEHVHNVTDSISYQNHQLISILSEHIKDGTIMEEKMFWVTLVNAIAILLLTAYLGYKQYQLQKSQKNIALSSIYRNIYSAIYEANTFIDYFLFQLILTLSSSDKNNELIKQKNKIRKIESSLRDIEVDVALFFSTDTLMSEYVSILDYADNILTQMIKENNTISQSTCKLSDILDFSDMKKSKFILQHIENGDKYESLFQCFCENKQSISTRNIQEEIKQTFKNSHY